MTSSRRIGIVGTWAIAVSGLLLLPVLEERSHGQSQRFGPTRPIVGEATVQLPDGRWLIVGGHGPSGPLADVKIVESGRSESRVLASRLHEARAQHAATVLADGSV